MMDKNIEHGKEVVRIEAEAVTALESRVDGDFSKAVEMIFAAKGRVVVTGMGKSGLIARKVAATMSSTGTPAVFLHPSDAVHGDIGMVQRDDVVICISKSGDTEEIRQILPTLRHLDVRVVAFVGNLNSYLAKHSDVVLDLSVKEEACPHDLAPTASTTAMMVMGDALAIALLHKRNFTREDFALFHPGGTLGKQLLLKVEALMVSGNDVPIVRETLPLPEAIVVMTSHRLGATCVVGEDGALLGIITDGDLRRLLQKRADISAMRAVDAMSKDPKSVRREILAARALELMESFKITQLIVIDEHRRPVGMIHLHDLVKAGLVSENGG